MKHSLGCSTSEIVTGSRALLAKNDMGSIQESAHRVLPHPFHMATKLLSAMHYNDNGWPLAFSIASTSTVHTKPMDRDQRFGANETSRDDCRMLLAKNEMGTTAMAMTVFIECCRILFNMAEESLSAVRPNERPSFYRNRTSQDHD